MHSIPERRKDFISGKLKQANWQLEAGIRFSSCPARSPGTETPENFLILYSPVEIGCVFDLQKVLALKQSVSTAAIGQRQLHTKQMIVMRGFHRWPIICVKCVNNFVHVTAQCLVIAAVWRTNIGLRDRVLFAHNPLRCFARRRLACWDRTLQWKMPYTTPCIKLL